MAEGNRGPDGPVDRLNRLFNTVSGPDGRLWSNRAAARALAASGHPISHTQIGNIRSGRRAARFVDMVAFARLFDRDPDYFTRPDPESASDTPLRPAAAGLAVPADPADEALPERTHRPPGRPATAGGALTAAQLAGKIDLLFTAVHPAGRPPHREAEVAAALRERGARVTEADIGQLRSGTIGGDPRSLTMIAEFFQVDPAYLLDATRSDDIERDLRAAVAMRRLGVRSIAARLCGLSDANLDAVARIVEQVVEALEPKSGSRPPGI